MRDLLLKIRVKWLEKLRSSVQISASNTWKLLSSNFRWNKNFNTKLEFITQISNTRSWKLIKIMKLWDPLLGLTGKLFPLLRKTVILPTFKKKFHTSCLSKRSQSLPQFLSKFLKRREKSKAFILLHVYMFCLSKICILLWMRENIYKLR